MVKNHTERSSRRAARLNRWRRKLLARLKHPFFNYPPIEYTVKKNKRSNRPIIMVVSHEASRTGAPILALDLVQRFGEKYDVISFLIRGGDLIKEFHTASFAVIEFLGTTRHDKDISRSIRFLAKKFDIHFAIINSLESRHVLPPLAREFIPTISLIHEFISYTPDKSAPNTAIFWSNKVIYPAPIVRDDSIKHCPEALHASLITLPQGKCTTLNDIQNDSSYEIEKNRLACLFRPEGWHQDTIVILGAGSVQIRKGIDLFICCAKRISELLPKASCRFIWIGDHYKPNNDFNYSCYLKDQITRSGLESTLSIIPPTRHIKAAYELANMMLITSRLDPLPNVAVDGICIGMPVLCFDKTTGIADLLKEGGVGEECVASYLDTEDMSQKAIKLIESRSKMTAISTRLTHLAARYFDMSKYVATLDSIALGAIIQANKEKEACEKISSMKLLDNKFAHAQNNTLSDKEVIREYVRGWASGINSKRPNLDFDPACYRTLQMTPHDHTDPLVHYAESGQPYGPWSNPVARN